MLIVFVTTKFSIFYVSYATKKLYMKIKYNIFTNATCS